MARTIFEKATKALLKDMIAEWKLQPGETFPAQRAIDWFANHYPKAKPKSIQAHLVQASTNDRSRLHHPSTNSTDDLLFKVGPREERLYSSTNKAPFLSASSILRQCRPALTDARVESTRFPTKRRKVTRRTVIRYLKSALVYQRSWISPGDSSMTIIFGVSRPHRRPRMNFKIST